MNPPIDIVCTMFNLPCRHCSNEHKNEIVREGTIADMNFKKNEVVVDLGLYCNNHPIGQSGWIKEMSSCPVIDDVMRWVVCRDNMKPAPQIPEKPKVRKKRTTRIVKPAKKPTRVKSRTARTVKVSKSKPLKKSIIVKKERVVKKEKGVGKGNGKSRRTTLPNIIQL